MKKDDFTRRDFIRITAGGAAAAWLTAKAGKIEPLAAAGAKKTAAKSRIARVVFPRVWKNENTLDEAAVEKMLRAGILDFTGEKTEEAAWKSLFTPKDVVGIKISCVGGRELSSNKTLVDAIARGLVGGGVKENNIIVWERFTPSLMLGGYRVNKKKTGVRCSGSEVSMARGGRGYDEGAFIRFGKEKCRVAKIITQDVTAIINVPVLKDHGSAGVTNCLKNIAYGGVDNTVHIHDNGCDPYIADICAMPEIKSKMRLCVVDALRCLYEGGPSDQPKNRVNLGEIHVGADQVALDTLGYEIIEGLRAKNGLPPLKKIGREPKYIKTAAARGLGTNQKSNMDIRTVKV